MTKKVAFGTWILIAGTAIAQTRVDLSMQSKSADLSGVGPTKTFQSGSVLPSTCTQGQTFFNSAASPGSNLYGCTALNIWTVMGGTGGGSGNVTIKTDSVLMGAENTLNFLSSPGMDFMVADDGAKLDITPSVRTSYFTTRDVMQSGADNYCAPTSGSATIYTCAEPHTLAAYADGMRFLWKPDVACSGGGLITLDVDGLGAKPIYQSDGSTNPVGAQCPVGSQVLLAYGAGLNAGTGAWRILSGTTVLPPISRILTYSFDGRGSALTTGSTGYLADVPFACTISSWALAVDQGTAAVDVWMTTNGVAAPTVSDKITGSVVPAIATGTRIRSTTLTGWTVNVPIHSVLAFRLDSVSLATSVNISVECDQ